jgi:hypothetical protein
MQSLDDKLFYLQSISKDLNTQLLTLIALRESTNEAHRKIAYRGQAQEATTRKRENLTAIFLFNALQNLPMSVDARSSDY